MGSPVFEAMFYGGMATTQNAKPVEVLDVQPEAFKHLLE
jgi:BTB/POZ domain